MREKLPRRSKRVVRHHPALPYPEAPAFLALLAGATGIAAAMLRFLIFTACRTNEAVEGRWSEIDRPNSAWKIPGERMKMDQDHYVPLSDPALAVLDELRDGRQGELIFTSPDGGAFSENAMLAVLDRLGYGHVTVHGFRSTFATWAEECTDHPDDVREAALRLFATDPSTVGAPGGPLFVRQVPRERMGIENPSAPSPSGFYFSLLFFRVF
ncbi:tyrosine-type recombinase/integrase [Bradyrhizobium ottawaense]|uniref:tyrosine-type recombinase/integrase n=1 Tax=Bradyrhizobium ottawaense TaxID=931866 RepID=UPI003D310835